MVARGMGDGGNCVQRVLTGHYSDFSKALFPSSVWKLHTFKDGNLNVMNFFKGTVFYVL